MTEIKKVGNRYYYFSREQFRSFPIKKAEAERMLAAGEAFLVAAFMNEPGGFRPLVEETAAPAEEIVEEAAVEAPESVTEAPENVVDFTSRKLARDAQREAEGYKAQFMNEILPKLTEKEIAKLSSVLNDGAEFRAEIMRIMLRLRIE